MVAVSPAAERARSGQVWLHGPVSDLLLGSGLLYLLTIPLLLFWARQADVHAWPGIWTSVIALGVSAPHYGATLLRVYEQRRDRQRYAFFTVHLTAALALAFGLALWDATLGAWLLTIYVTWSPWHFAGQNYGLALMTLRRRGVPIDAGVKRTLYASFLLSFLLATIPLHMQGSGVVFAQGASDGAGAIRVLRAGIPAELARWAAPLLALGYLATLVRVARRLLANAPARDLVPAALIVATQALWFAVPAYGIASGAWSDLGLAFAAIWISGAHALQYLWVTSYYAKQGASGADTAPYLGKALLVGSLIVLPQLVFVPGLLGPYVPNAASVAILSFSVINLHHFLLDGAIWKLRDGRVARVLLGTPGEEDSEQGPRRAWLRLAILALGAVCLLRPFYVYWELRVGTSAQGVEPARLERSADRLAFLGIENAPVLVNLGWRREQQGKRDAALAAYATALDRTPGDSRLAAHVVELLLGGDAQERARALALARNLAIRSRSSDPAALRTLERAARANGALEVAERASQRAAALEGGASAAAPPGSTKR